MINVVGWVRGKIITPLELTTSYNRWQNERINSDFHPLMAILLKIELQADTNL